MRYVKERKNELYLSPNIYDFNKSTTLTNKMTIQELINIYIWCKHRGQIANFVMFVLLQQEKDTTHRRSEIRKGYWRTFTIPVLKCFHSSQKQLLKQMD